MRICRTLLPFLLLAGCVGSPVAPAPNDERPSTASLRAFAGPAHCPRYSKGSGILADGDFRAMADPATYLTFSKGQHLAPKWTVTTRTVDLAGTTFWNFDHLCSVDLDGTSAVGAIQHTGIATQKGATYSLTFLMSGNSYCGATIKKMKVIAGNKSVVFKWNDANGNSVEYGKFGRRHMTFTASGQTAALKFISLDAAGSGCGPVIAAVAVTKA